MLEKTIHNVKEVEVVIPIQKARHAPVPDEVIRYFVRKRLERHLRKEVQVRPEAISIEPIADISSCLLFNHYRAYRGGTINLIESISHIWLVSFWHAKSKTGIQMLVSYNALMEDETGQGLDIETWWPVLGGKQ